MLSVKVQQYAYTESRQAVAGNIRQHSDMLLQELWLAMSEVQNMYPDMLLQEAGKPWLAMSETVSRYAFTGSS